ncbi:MAG: hypothetical protein F6K42_23180, partial [Leptolyngbya sp. SIO1D8]|nr:hypothetical protein [Leptolyngbya sp. SIO1D8]
PWALVVYPNLEDRELGYPLLMLEFLPPVLLGLVVASLIAAFMSTVSTLINWGASYLTNDLYGRFISRQAEQEELLLAGRVASVLVTVLGAITAFYIEDVTTIFRLVIAIGTGPGLVLILRWFWWRINAAAELASMVAGFLMGLLTMPIPEDPNPNNLMWPLLEIIQARLPILQVSDFGERLLVISGITTLLWVSVLLITAPESPETLDRFYQKVRPSGPGWNPQRLRVGERPIHYVVFADRGLRLNFHQPGIAPQQNLLLQLQQVIAGLGLLFGSMFAVGGFLLLQSGSGWVGLIVAAFSSWWLRQLSRARIEPMPRPGLEDIGNEIDGS